MKSKTFFSKYFKEQFKKQFWFMGIMAFLLFLTLPMSLLIDFENMKHAEYVFRERQNSFVMHIIQADLLHIVVIAGGAVAALVQFQYLHSRKRVDFYHSLPIRKEKLYWMKLLTVYLDFAIPYTLMIVISLFMGAANGLMCEKAFYAYFAMWLIYQLAFILIYVVASVAMLLTGRVFVGIMGTGILMFLPALIDSTLESYKLTFFSTYFDSYLNRSLSFILSPGILALQIRNALTFGKDNLIQMSSELLFGVITALVFTAVFVLLGYYLMKKRPSEAAGSSMAFSIPARIIHVVLSIIGAMVIGLLAVSMTYSDNTVWLIAGVVLGGFFLYILIQFIYTMDFRKVLRYKWQLLLVEVISIGIACLFCFDLTGFDSYIPEMNEIKSVSLSIPDGYNNEFYYVDGSYVDAEEYRLKNMNLTVSEELYDMLEDAIQTSNLDEDAAYDGALYYMQVCYKLQNGKERNRVYRMDMMKYKEFFASLYDQQHFKDVMMPLYSMMKADGEYRIELQYENEYTELFGDDQEKLREFVQILKDDFKNLSGNAIVNELPIAELNIFEKSLDTTYSVYIYPSNTRTIQYLEEGGYSLETSLTPDRILKIEVEDYRSTEEEGVKDVIGTDEMVSVIETVEGVNYMTYTEQEEIAEILPFLINNSYNYPWHNSHPDLYATVTYIGKDGYQKQMGCSFLEGELPKCIEVY